MKCLSVLKSNIPVTCTLLVLCGGGVFALAQAVFTEYTGSYKNLGIIAPGVVECPGGEPTGLWPYGLPCSQGSRFRVRGLVRKWYVQSTDSRVTGQFFTVVNGNFDGWPGSGPMWGTAKSEMADGGVWEGNWTGQKTATGETVNSVMHGSGGNIEGLVKEEDASSTGGLWTVAGRILQPASK